MDTLLAGNYNDSHLVNIAMSKTLEFISDSKEILGVLSHSKDHGTAVAINAVFLGPGFIVTAVEDIILDLDGDITIILKSFDMTGHFLDCKNIKLSEIHGVIQFESIFPNPYLKEIKNNNANVA